MAWLLQSIDALARKAGRDVLYLHLADCDGEPAEHHPAFADITAWLDAEGIGWEECAGFCEDDTLVEGGAACLYLDVPYLPDSDAIRRLEGKFMDGPSGPAIAGVVPAILPLEAALRHAYRDDPDQDARF